MIKLREILRKLAFGEIDPVKAELEISKCYELILKEKVSELHKEAYFGSICLCKSYKEASNCEIKNSGCKKGRLLFVAEEE